MDKHGNLFRKVDVDEDGNATYMEFLMYLDEMDPENRERFLNRAEQVAPLTRDQTETLWHIFDDFDMDGDGNLNSYELRALDKRGSLLSAVDMNADKQIDVYEWLAWCTQMKQRRGRVAFNAYVRWLESMAPLSRDEHAELKKIFLQLDTDGSLSLSRSELKRLDKNGKLSSAVDRDEDDQISFQEYESWLCDLKRTKGRAALASYLAFAAQSAQASIQILVAARDLPKPKEKPRRKVIGRATTLDTVTTQRALDVLAEFDYDGDGYIQASEIQMMDKPGHLFQKLDVDEDGDVSYMEFLMYLDEMDPENRERFLNHAEKVAPLTKAQNERLWNIFDDFDANGSGLLSAAEVRAIDKRGKLLSTMDTNTDKQIDVDEWLEWCTQMKQKRGREQFNKYVKWLEGTVPLHRNEKRKTAMIFYCLDRDRNLSLSRRELQRMDKKGKFFAALDTDKVAGMGAWMDGLVMGPALLPCNTDPHIIIPSSIHLTTQPLYLP